MKNVGIIVEVINRELDNDLLLKAELENRGYNVSVYHKTESLSFRYNDILLIPNCYNTKNYNFYKYRFNCKSGCLINMQYEQVLSKDGEYRDFNVIKGKGLDIIHMCWGENSIKRLCNYGVPSRNLFKTGAIQLDNTRDEFNSIWKSKDELSKEFDIPKRKKWILFISSFSCADDSLVIDKLKEISPEERITRFKECSSQSQRIILSWFDNLLNIYKNYCIIYRPHPVELNSNILNEMSDKYKDSFFCIQDYNVKQWIKASDIVTTWFSTSIVESVYMKKTCFILRPINIDDRDECLIYNNAYFIKSFDEFKKTITKYNFKSFDILIDKQVLNSYYDVTDTPTFMRIADLVDLSKNRSVLEKNFGFRRILYLIQENIIFKIIVKRVYQTYYKITKSKIKNEKIRGKFFLEEWEKSIDNIQYSKNKINERVVVYKSIINQYYKNSKHN